LNKGLKGQDSDVFEMSHVLHEESDQQIMKIRTGQESFELSCSFLNRQQGAAECKTCLVVRFEDRRNLLRAYLKSGPSGSVTHPKVSLLCSLSINHLRRTDGVCVHVCVCVLRRAKMVHEVV